VARLESAPGVESAALATAIPFDVGLCGTVVVTEVPTSSTSNDFVRAYLGVTPGYFATMRTPLVAGRVFDARDRADSPRVAIVSRSLARAKWGPAEPIGQRLRVQDGRQPAYGGEPQPWFTVVGVVDDVRFAGPADEPSTMLYLPIAQYWDTVTLRALLRMPGGLAQAAATLQAAVHELDPNAAVSDVRSYDERVAANVARPRFAAYLLGAFAAVAVFLAAIGVYGVLSYAMSRRIPEIGIRVAFGAGEWQVFRLLFGQGLRITIAGIVAGVPLAFGATQMLGSLLFGVEAASLDVFAIVVAALLAVGLAASYGPARRAVRIDPVQALRGE
jgi:putative ABC transport system permease protein